MKIAVLGAGMMGRAAVHDLARAEGISDVLVMDREAGRAAEVAARHGGGKAWPFSFDIKDVAELQRFLSGCDAAVGAVSYRFNASMTLACIEAGVHYCDLGGNNSVVQEQFALSDEAERAGVAVVPDCGLAPGMIGIVAMRALELNPTADSIRIRVGGIPAELCPPFNYQVVFSVEGLINEYKEPTFALRGGEIVQVPTLGDLEEIVFPEPFGRLEAFNTSGGASTLPWTLRDRVKNLDYKTIRYPGHRDLIDALFALGFSDEDSLDIDGARIAPRRILESLMARTLSSQKPDVVLALVEAEGPDGTAGFRLVDRFDAQSGLSAMMRCTAFPAAVIAHMLASGAVTERGTLHQEKVIPAEPFVAALRGRGIQIEEISRPAE